MNLEEKIESYKSSGNSISALILEAYQKKVKFDGRYNELMYEFIDKAHVLEVDSEFMYQIEKNIKLNKISLKQYVLTSDVCLYLKNNNIHDYDISELKGYINKYEETYNINCSNVLLALDLYEMLESMEKVFDKKIDVVINDLRGLLSNIDDIKECNDKTIEQIYNKFQIQITNEYLNTNIIDNEIYTCFINMISEAVMYYSQGYPVLSV